MTKIGLTSEEAAQSLQRYGNNALSKPPQQTFFDKLLDNFQDPTGSHHPYSHCGFAHQCGFCVYGLRGLD